MPLSNEQQQILLEVGDPNATIGTLIPTIWSLYADKAGIDSRLQGLYTKRACLDVRMAEEVQNTDLQVLQDVVDKQGQRSLHLQEMRDRTHTEIVRIEAVARAGRGPVVGSLTKLAPFTPTDNGPDANDPRYVGTPYQLEDLTW